MPKAIMIVLAIGTGAMLVPIVAMMACYKEKLWKSVPVSILLTVTGTLGTYIWCFVEDSTFGGRSYYGAVFLVPLAFLLVAKWMKIPYGNLMDYCAPAECIMLAIMKYQCLIDGCCGGITLCMPEDGVAIYFPSQIVELINALVIMVVLMVIAYRKKYRGKVYAWYLIIYGATRFVLNWFRSANYPLLLGLPAGNLWSLLALFIGLLWLTDRKITITKRASAEKEIASLTDENIL